MTLTSDDLDLDDHINTISWLLQKNLVSNSQNNQFCKSDLELDPMALVLKIDLDRVKMYHHTKKEVSMSRHSKIIAGMDRQTHRQTV